MQSNRLFRLLYYLIDKKHTTAPELAEKFEVSVRTIYRDIDALSEAGIPVYSQAGKGGGIYILRDFVVDKACFSEDERQEILMAMQSLSGIQCADNRDIIDKLSAVFHVAAENWIEVDFSRWGVSSGDNEKFERIKLAIIHRNPMVITYAGSNGITGRRKIYPLKLYYKSRAWYVKAYCTREHEYRIFKLNRILESEIVKEIFSCPPFPKESGVAESEYNQITLRFPKEMTFRIYDEFDKADITVHENGDLLVCARIPENAWLTEYILSFGTQVEIIEPISLKEKITEQVMALYNKYKT